MNVRVWRSNSHIRPALIPTVDGTAQKHNVTDPKESELFLGKLKPEEILVEDCRRSDAQIDVRI